MASIKQSIPAINGGVFSHFAIESKNMERRIIHESPDEIGGHCAYSEIPIGYEGNCAIYNGECFPEKEIGVFPNRQEAEAAAWYATTPDGGYSYVTAKVADQSSQITHQSWIDWVCG